jgi:hypothetical protein
MADLYDLFNVEAIKSLEGILVAAAVITVLVLGIALGIAFFWHKWRG